MDINEEKKKREVSEKAKAAAPTDDYIVRAMAGNGSIRAFAATTRNLVEYARNVHNTSPVVTAALGRLLTAGGMMGAMMKGQDDLLTLQIQCDGPIGGLCVTADSQANVKGYANRTDLIMPPNYLGKLDVGAALNQGTLTVIRDLGLKEPYSGQVPLTTGEIGDDLTYYFAYSEQIPSAVGLGVLMNRDNTVAQAGGFILQLMPFADEKVIDRLEENVNAITSVTDLLEQGMTPEEILDYALTGLGPVEITDRIPTAFKCNCSRERVTKALITMGKKELRSLIGEGKDVELNCQFCNSHYVFSPEELEEIYRQL